jgi:hypothetical protein
VIVRLLGILLLLVCCCLCGLGWVQLPSVQLRRKVKISVEKREKRKLMCGD